MDRVEAANAALEEAQHARVEGGGAIVLQRPQVNGFHPPILRFPTPGASSPFPARRGCERRELYVAICLAAIGGQHGDVVATPRKGCSDRAHLRRRPSLTEVGV